MWNVGDLVFVRISGYPWWPGQVGGSHRALKRDLGRGLPHGNSEVLVGHPALQVMATDKVGHKFMALKKDGTAPVNFFGDNEFGWCLSEDMVSFNKHYSELSEQKMTRQYRVSSQP